MWQEVRKRRNWCNLGLMKSGFKEKFKEIIVSKGTVIK